MVRHIKGEKKTCQTERKCPKCRGLGHSDWRVSSQGEESHKRVRCVHCNGTGVIIEWYSISFNGSTWLMESINQPAERTDGAGSRRALAIAGRLAALAVKHR